MSSFLSCLKRNRNPKNKPKISKKERRLIINKLWKKKDKIYSLNENEIRKIKKLIRRWENIVFL
jgi:hypothetical protein